MLVRLGERPSRIPRLGGLRPTRLEFLRRIVRFGTHGSRGFDRDDCPLTDGDDFLDSTDAESARHLRPLKFSAFPAFPPTEGGSACCLAIALD